MMEQRPATKRHRPIRPKLDWMVCPNVLAYCMAWYGLFVGKFPFQVLSFSLGLCLICASGLHRISISDLKPEDYLPTDSRSNLEKQIAIDFDVKKHPQDWTNPAAIIRSTEAARVSQSSVSSNLTRQSRSLSASPRRASSKEQKNRQLLSPVLFENSVDWLADESNSDWKHISVLPWTNARPIQKRQINRDFRSFRNQKCRSNSILFVARPNASDVDGRPNNLLNRTIVREIRRLEAFVFSIFVTVKDENKAPARYFYDSVGNRTGLCTRGRGGGCSGFNTRTMHSFVLSAKEDPLDLLLSPTSAVALTYPNYFLLDLSSFLGGVRTINDEPNGVVEHVAALREVFCINEYHFDKAVIDAGAWITWEERFDAIVRHFFSPYFDIYWITEHQKNSEQNALINDMLPKVAVTFLALMLWCTVGALSRDAVRSKPWAGFVGVFATMTATCAGFGLCLWREAKFSPVLMAVPLLTLAIGLDDMFIILETWSRTPSTLPVEERMMLSMRTGGTSIFITFVINLLDFIIGNYTPYPIINYLSSAATVTILFDFFCQMTIFCSCLTLFGRSEPKNLHACVCCLTIPARDLDNSDIYVLVNEPKAKRRIPALCRLICCSNPAANSCFNRPMMQSQPVIDLFCRHLFTNIGRLIAVVLFVVYLALSVWSISYVGVGMKPERIFRSGSNLYDYMHKERQWFSDFSPEVVAIINRDVDYASPAVQLQLLDYAARVENCGYFWSKDETSFWLRDFLSWYELTKPIENNETCCRNVAQMLSEIQWYPDGFLMTEPYGRHSRDMRANLNSTRILRSRLRFRAKKANTPERQIKMMEAIRQISDNYKAEFDIVVYSSDFLLYDQFLTVVPATLYYSGITLAVTIGVAFFMIPNLICVFWVGLSVVAILAGIVGLMHSWDMDLDSVTLINLLIAITLSADFVTHAAYIYLVSSPMPKKLKNTNQTTITVSNSEIRIGKACAMVSEVGSASVLAAIGTTMSVLAMSTSDAYIFVTFFRIMFLTILLSLIHALVFLPVFLSIFGPVSSPALEDNNNRPPKIMVEPHLGDNTNINDVIETASQSTAIISPASHLAKDNLLLNQLFSSLEVDFYPLACSTKRRRRTNKVVPLGSDLGPIQELLMTPILAPNRAIATPKAKTLPSSERPTVLLTQQSDIGRSITMTNRRRPKPKRLQSYDRQRSWRCDAPI